MASQLVGKGLVCVTATSRRSAAVLLATIAGLVSVFAVLAERVTRHEAFGWDRALFDRLHGHEKRGDLIFGGFDVLDAVLTPGVGVIALVSLLVIELVLLARRPLREAAFLPIALVGSIVFSFALKTIFQVPPVSGRGHGYSFPSGHAAASMASFAALAVLAWRTRSSWWWWATLVLGSLAVLIVGVALVYNGWHRPSDVLAGWCLSLAWVTALCAPIRIRRGRARL